MFMAKLSQSAVLRIPSLAVRVQECNSLGPPLLSGTPIVTATPNYRNGSAENNKNDFLLLVFSVVVKNTLGRFMLRSDGQSGWRSASE